MSDTKAVSSELELDGHIYLVAKDEEGNVVERSELNSEVCLKVIIAVLDDAIKNPALEALLSAEIPAEE